MIALTQMQEMILAAAESAGSYEASSKVDYAECNALVAFGLMVPVEGQSDRFEVAKP